MLVTFETTTSAMAFEEEAKKAGLNGRLIPVPKQITAGCGLSYCAPVREKDRTRQLAEKMLAGTEVPQQLASFATGLEDDEKALAACGGSMELFLQVLAGGTEAK